MKKQIYDEKNGLSYTLHGDYYLPDLEINEEEPAYGKYGMMRDQVEWVRRMNNIKNIAEESVMKIIYS